MRLTEKADHSYRLADQFCPEPSFAASLQSLAITTITNTTTTTTTTFIVSSCIKETTC